MKVNVIFQKLWAAFDRLLLGAVAILLGTVWYVSGWVDAEAATEPERTAPAQPRRETVRRPPGRAVNGLRVSTARTRMNSIAQSMAESGWACLPCSPAMDMREDGKMYEISVTLPAGVAQDSVRVTTAGSMLTLAMKADGADGQTYLRRVRLPCAVERAEHVTSAISNNVLHVRIQPPATL
ncbi:MAG: hypothetical protein LBW77_00510 [Verrucomicrobiota bacterium]|jgi:HSP20 family molecular chaperone IbpA|nr:hypothetical protein [Verrucomicrobiota bacterium]